MKVCFIIAFALLANGLFAQSLPFSARNTIYFEGFGSGGVYSLNYERLFSLKTNQTYGFRVGGSIVPGRANMQSLVGEVNTLVGSGNYYGDFGLGLTVVSKPDTRESFVGTDRVTLLSAVPRIGYRYQKPSGGLMFRVAWTPFVSLSRNQSKIVYPFFFGLAIGHSF